MGKDFGSEPASPPRRGAVRRMVAPAAYARQFHGKDPADG